MADDRGTENKVGLIIGLVLIAVGLSALLNASFLPWLEPFRAIWRVGRDVTGPLVLILIGAAVIYYANRGGFRAPGRGQRLYRSRGKKMIAGVMGGLSDYLGVDVTILRLAAVALAVFTPFPIVIAYIVAAIVVPLEPEAGAPPAAPPER